MGNCKAGWLFRHPSNRAAAGQQLRRSQTIGFLSASQFRTKPPQSSAPEKKHEERTRGRISGVRQSTASEAESLETLSFSASLCRTENVRLGCTGGGREPGNKPSLGAIHTLPLLELRSDTRISRWLGSAWLRNPHPRGSKVAHPRLPAALSPVGCTIATLREFSPTITCRLAEGSGTSDGARVHHRQH